MTAIREVFKALPGLDAPVRYFEQDCTRGCADEKGRPVVIAAATEEQVRQFMSRHRNLSACVERAHRYAQRVLSGDIAKKREAKVEKEAAKAAAVAIPAPIKKPPKPSWKNAKKTTTTGWDGRPLA